jgi:uncharacterized membrane protein YhaH (DUF805 family)
MDWKFLFLAVEGRIPRRSFWIAVALLLWAELIVLSLAGMWSWDAATNPAPLWFRMLQFVLTLLTAYPFYAVLAKRLHDRNSPETLAQVTVGGALLSDFVNIVWPMEIPDGLTPAGYIINIPLILLFVVIVIELGMRRGAVGPNRFGPDPLEAAQ